MFEEIKTEKLYIKVVKQIRRLIEQGRLKPGEKLPPEAVLAEKLKVSRPSVREAIVALEIMGLVESIGGKGSFIKKVSSPSVLDENFRHLEEDESPFELLEARMMIEPEVTGRAAEKAQEEDVARLKQCLEQMYSIQSRLSVSQEYEDFLRLDNEFHIDVARSAHNVEILRVVAHLVESSTTGLSMRFRQTGYCVPERRQRYLEEHRGILVAIQSRNRHHAREAMEEHLAGCQRDLFGET